MSTAEECPMPQSTSLIELVESLSRAITAASDAQLLRDRADSVEAGVAVAWDRDRLRSWSDSLITAVGALASQVEGGQVVDINAASVALTSLRNEVLRGTTGLDGWPVK